MINLDIVKSNEITQLYDFYKNLLTEKQKNYFELYFFEDLTLQEISNEFGISRNAVYDSLLKTINLLNDYEEKLKLNDKALKLKMDIENYKNNKLDITTLIAKIEEEL